MNGIASGYLNLSPLAAFTLEMIMQITRNTSRNPIIGKPIIIKQSGMARIIYNKMESWKFIDAFPFSFTHADSSFLDNQQISGPMIPPNGKKKPANADR